MHVVEEMISLSNVIKSSHVLTQEELRNLMVFKKYPLIELIEEQEDEEPMEVGPDEETIKLKEKILEDAKIFAANRIQDAAVECEKMFVDAQSQIELWWLEKRNEDEQIKAEVAQNAYDEAYQQGMIASQTEMEQLWSKNINEAASILADAYKTREQIIQESEPYIVDLTCSIAEKIIGKQLELKQELILEMIHRSLSRRREQGEITLCVSPANLNFVQAGREELISAIDSQAELLIIPDISVKDDGCVIRSKFGSIDARVDTQLSEIKRELLVIAHQTVQESRLGDEQA